MGKPLEYTLADIFMAKIERAASEQIRQQKLHKRFLNDIFVVSEDRERIETLIGFLNSNHPSVSFTNDFEQNNAIAFLDVLISRKPDGTISRSVYHKPSWTGLYQNFLSFCPMQYKRGLVRTLFNRARRICTVDTLPTELQLITDTLKKNNYPEKFIQRHSEIRPNRGGEVLISSPSFQRPSDN